jgi:hypothetical protein
MEVSALSRSSDNPASWSSRIRIASPKSRNSHFLYFDHQLGDEHTPAVFSKVRLATEPTAESRTII